MTAEPAARLGGPALAFAAAYSLSIAASEALVTAVARLETGGDPARLAGAARRFALSSSGLTACGCLEGLLLLGIAIVAARLEGPRVAGRLGLRRAAFAPGLRVAAVLGLVGLTFAYGAATDLAGATHEGVMDALAGALYRPSAGRFVLAIGALAVVPAVGEEALFRGYVQAGLAPTLGRWPAIVLTSVAFGVFHRDPLQGAGAFVAGLFLGWTADRAGGIGPGILAHAANNATFVVLASFGAAGALARGVQVASLALGAALCAAATFVLARSPSLEGERAG